MKKINELTKLMLLGIFILIYVSVNSVFVSATSENKVNSLAFIGSDVKSMLEEESSHIESVQKEEPISIVAETEETASTDDQITTVSTWSEFAKAFKDNTVTHIEFKNDIAYGTGGSDSIPTEARTKSLIIDGKDFTLNMGPTILYLNPKADGAPVLTVQNISDVKINQGLYFGALQKGFVTANYPFYADRYRNSTWTINFSNIKNQPRQYPRLANNSGGQVNFTGDVTWYCDYTELLATSGVKIEDNVTVSSYKTAGAQSFIWFDRGLSKKIDSDAGTDDIVIGKNATLNCRMGEKGDPAYPVVFSYYKNFILEDGATFNGTMPGNAYRADYAASKFKAEGNNKINLTSLRDGYAPVKFMYKYDRDDGNSETQEKGERTFYVGSGSEFYIEAGTDSSLFDTVYTKSTREKEIGQYVDIQIDSPKILDLNNYSSAKNDNSSILSAKSTVKNFSIKNSNLTLFQTSQDADSEEPAGIFDSVDSLIQTGGGDTLKCASSDSNVTNFLPLSTIRRINALNVNPTVNFIDVTNAQKSIQYETVLGEYPDKNGMDENGHINYIKVYPYEGGASANITDTYNEVHTGVLSGKDGITTLQTDKFNQAGEYTSGIAIYGKRTQDEATTYKVWDVVPPEPAVVTSTDLTEGVTSLSGTGEAGATVYLKIDGNAIDSATTTVDSDGKWTLTFDGGLSTPGSVAQIFLEDNAGKADITNPPTTNNERGNINPESDLTYQDAVFKAATKVTFTKSNFTIEANDMTIHAKDYPKTDDELKALILKNSEAKLTNADTNEELDATNLSVDISQLPSTSSETVAKGSYNVVLSFERGASTFTKEIKVTISTSSKMSIKQVYKGTETPIYSDIIKETPVDNTQKAEVNGGDEMEEIINNLISNNLLTLNYDGYNENKISEYKIYQNGKEVSPTPTTAPDDDFTIVYEYEGQLKFDKAAKNIDFGSIPLSNDNKSKTALTESSDQIIAIIDTVPNGNWTLKAATPAGIKDSSDNNRQFLGTLIYINEDGSEQNIDASATKIETKKDNKLYKEVSMKNKTTGLFLQQNGGNLKGKYSGKMIWTLEDSP